MKAEGMLVITGGRVRSTGGRGRVVLFPKIKLLDVLGWVGPGMAPGRPEQQLSDDRPGLSAVWALTLLVLFFFVVSVCRHLLTAAVWTPPRLASAWIPSPQNISPRRVNIIFFFLQAHGVVSRVLIPLPSVPLWPAFQRIQAALPLPRPCHLTRNVCVTPQPAVPDTLRSGEGSHSHLPVQIPRASG